MPLPDISQVICHATSVLRKRGSGQPIVFLHRVCNPFQFSHPRVYEMADEGNKEGDQTQHQMGVEKDDPPTPEVIALAKALMDAIGKGSYSSQTLPTGPPPPTPSDPLATPKDGSGKLIHCNPVP